MNAITRDAVSTLAAIDRVLYADGPDTEWDAGTIEIVAEILAGYTGREV